MRRVLLLAAAAFALAATAAGAADVKLLNVSYDPTRELYRDLGAAFAKQWKAKTGDTVVLSTSNGGSGAQARAVIDGFTSPNSCVHAPRSSSVAPLSDTGRRTLTPSVPVRDSTALPSTARFAIPAPRST